MQMSAASTTTETTNDEPNEDSVILVVVGGAAGQAADDSFLFPHGLDFSNGTSHALEHSNILFRLAASDHATLAVETGVEGHVKRETSPVMAPSPLAHKH